MQLLCPETMPASELVRPAAESRWQTRAKSPLVVSCQLQCSQSALSPHSAPHAPQLSTPLTERSIVLSWVLVSHAGHGSSRAKEYKDNM